MAETLDDGEFWLPSHFLTDDDILMNKGNVNRNGVKPDIKLNLFFPTEFPYEFGLLGSSNSALSSPVESVVGSTETESDEEDFLAGLTRQLTHSTLQEAQKLAVPKFNTPEKFETWVMAGSPQSTLSGIGSWSGRSAASGNGSPNGSSQVSSPPTTPLSTKDDAWDLIYAAAGQVARLKMSGEGPPSKYQQGRGLLGPPRNPTQVPLPPMKIPNTSFYSNDFLTQSTVQRNQFQQVKQEQGLNQQGIQCSSVWGRQAKAEWLSQQKQVHQNRGRSVGYENGRSGGRPLGLPQSAWPSLQDRNQQHHQHNSASDMRAVFLGGSGVRRECTGTGVFLPRRYNNNTTTDTRKKPGCSTVLLPARVVQALNLNLEDMNAHSQQQRFNGGLTADYDALMARRNALLTQQKRNYRPEGAAMNHEVCLPQEWTY